MGFVVEKATLTQVFPEYFGFPCQAFHRLLHTSSSSIIRCWENRSVAASVIMGLLPIHPKRREGKEKRKIQIK
jgi:hypothetical protein